LADFDFAQAPCVGHDSLREVDFTQVSDKCKWLWKRVGAVDTVNRANVSCTDVIEYDLGVRAAEASGVEDLWDWWMDVFVPDLSE
jgi:hypothetical protein